MPRNGSLTEEDLKTHLAQDFAKWSIPDRFVFVAEIPKSGVGKYDKKAVRALHAEGGDEAIRSTLGTP
ncbi:hypothetical protein GCM10023200_24740 [Actinomycetospora chlora]|uniref:AMP-binding enzyme C-terminal domain-containing protein n=1 Tax=Actinomycetospora chlora TaxID=663608 RepID=A0ABP9B150_9PSEU